MTPVVHALRRNPLAAAAVGLLAGLGGMIWGIPAVGIGLVLVFMRKKSPPGKDLARAGGILALLAIIGMARQQGEHRAVVPLPQPGATVVIDGTVGRVFTPPPKSSSRAWFTCAANQPPNHIIYRVDLPDGQMPPLPGTVVRVSGVFFPPERPTNPYEWDEASAFRDKGLAGKIRLRRDQFVGILHPPPWWHPMAMGERVRRSIAANLAAAITDPDECAVVLGIALGLDDGLGDAPMLAFRRTGSYHLFSVSGMHVAMLVSILWLVLEPLAMPRRRLVGFILPVVLGYTVVTGWEAPAVRAALMTTILLSALAIDRTPRILNSLAAAFIVLLLWDPRQRLDLGFQLTFTVVLALIVIGLPLAKKLSFLGQPDPFLPPELVSMWQLRWWGATRMLVGSVCFGLAASIGSLPLSIQHFNMVTPSGILVGLALMPLSWVILLTALMMALASTLGAATVCSLLGHVAALCASACIGLCTWAMNLPGAWMMPRHAPGQAVEAIVFDLDRGGSSMLVRTASRAVLIDTGNPGHAKRIVGRAGMLLGTCPPDLLAITHGDAQHRGGMDDLRRILGPPALEWFNPPASSSATTGSIHLTALFPPPDNHEPRADDRASVLRCDMQGWRVMWVGDAGFGPQKWLLANQPADALHADVLCVGWHQTDIGLLREFIAAVHPGLVIWHRWRAETLNPPGENLRSYLKQNQIPLLEQSHTGAITLGIGTDTLVATPFLPGSVPVTLSRGDASAIDESSSPAPATGSQNP